MNFFFGKEILDGRFKNEYKMKKLKQQDGKKFYDKMNFNKNEASLANL